MPLSLLTESFLKKSGNLLQVVPEVSDPTSGYHMFHSDEWEQDGGSVEVEVAEFLYGLVRMMRPHIVLETGTHAGISSAYMGQALKDNSDNNFSNHIISLEYNNWWCMWADKLHSKLDVLNFITVVNQDSCSYKNELPIDILFLDSEPDIRYKELEYYWSQVKPGGIIMIHDLHPNMSYASTVNPDHPELGNYWPFGDFKPIISEKIGLHRLMPVHFRTPRGFSMYYKVHLEEDQDIKEWSEFIYMDF